MKRLVLLALLPAGAALAATPPAPPKAHTVMMSDTVMSLASKPTGTWLNVNVTWLLWSATFRLPSTISTTTLGMLASTV
mgnify:CR=1 FL=1